MSSDTSSKKMIRIGVTGHRKISHETCLALAPVIKQAIENIIEYNKAIFNTEISVVVVSSIAQGADIFFTNIALENFDCKLKVVLPFSEKDYCKDFNDDLQKKNFDELLLNNKTMEPVTLESFVSTEKNIQYLNAGKYIIDDSDYIVAIWNEQKANGIGGTADVVEYAISRKKNLLVINPFEKILNIKGDYLPELISFNQTNSFALKSGGNIIKSAFNFYDAEAVKNQKKYKAVWKRCFNLGLVAALLFSIEIAFFESTVLLKQSLFTAILLNCFAVACIFCIATLIRFENKKSFYKNHTLNRYIAERLRIQNIFFDCGYGQQKINNSIIHPSATLLNSLTPLSASYKLLQLCAYSKASIAEKKQKIRNLVNEQAAYHNQRVIRLLKKFHNNKIIRNRLFYVFIAFVIADIVSKIIKTGNFIIVPGFISELILFLSLLIPAVIARLEAVRYLNEWEKLIAHSKYLINYFENLLLKNDNAGNDTELNDVINLLNENMYMENLEWEMFMHTKNEILQ